MSSISVIVPVYGVEAYLSRCVDSILSQTLPDFDLILVDDGSLDGSGAICDRYGASDPRVHVIHQKNGGLSAARNAGIRYALAESGSRYLSFIDSDDYISPRFLEALLSAAEELSCPIAACGVCKTQGGPLPEEAAPVFVRRTAGDYYCQEEDVLPEVACNKLYRKSLFQSLRFPAGRLHEDEFTTYQAVYAAGAVAETRAALYAYFQNPGGITGSKWKPGRMDALDAFLEQAAFARRRQEDALLRKAALSLIYGACGQLPLADRPSRAHLRRRLRQGLALGRESGCFPLTQGTLWAYEAAYPCKPLWYLASRLKK